MPVSEQNQVAASITQRKYVGSLDEVREEAQEQIRSEWLKRGYFKAEVNTVANVLGSDPSGERIALMAHVDEGAQYRLREISFENNNAVRNVEALRNLLPIKNSDIFNREKIVKGLANLRRAYLQLGYINFTLRPNTRIDEDAGTISLNVDMQEGKQFYVSRIDIIGADRGVLKDLELKPGQVYNVRLVEIFLRKELPRADVDNPNIQKLSPDERTGTVAITFDFRSCPTE